jgi:hypothetical protein
MVINLVICNLSLIHSAAKDPDNMDRRSSAYLRCWQFELFPTTTVTFLTNFNINPHNSCQYIDQILTIHLSSFDVCRA